MKVTHIKYRMAANHNLQSTQDLTICPSLLGKQSVAVFE